MATDAVLDFLGANETVTGSKTLLTYRDERVLVDCGLYQGQRELRQRNWDHFDPSPSSITSVVLTHAHLDHCGYLPLLVRQGFSGPVHCTAATAELARIVLLDSAHLAEEDARNASRHGWSKHSQPRPLYTAEDVERSLRKLVTHEHGAPFEAADGITAHLDLAGHILGSATVHLDLAGASVLLSGDLGRDDHPVLRPPSPPRPARFVVVESTYGDRDHADTGLDHLAAAIRRTVGRGGSVLIPAFAVDRTEVVLHALKRLMDAQRVPRVPVYVDSPMALKALDLYRRAVTAGDPQVRSSTTAEGDPFDPGGGMEELHTPEESRSINRPAFPCIIVSASGMATGGRVLHHLEHLLPEDRNAVVLVGYQAVGTRGRDLADGARQLKMHGRYVPVRAEVVVADGFSVHADGDELLAWLGRLSEPPEACFVNHGEPDSARALAARITDELGWLAVVPRFGERIRLC